MIVQSCSQNFNRDMRSQNRAYTQQVADAASVHCQTVFIFYCGKCKAAFYLQMYWLINVYIAKCLYMYTIVL